MSSTQESKGALTSMTRKMSACASILDKLHTLPGSTDEDKRKFENSIAVAEKIITDEKKQMPKSTESDTCLPNDRLMQLCYQGHTN
jgi:hypothetical protein